MASTVTGVLLTGIHSARPSSGVTAGTLYSCTTHALVYQTSDTGSTWATWATLGSSGSGTVTTVKDEGSNLSTAVASIDFVGAGVTASGTTAVTVTIPGAALAHGRVAIASGNYVSANTSATDMTSMTVTVVTGANPCHVAWTLTAFSSNSSADLIMDIAIDGTLQGGTNGLVSMTVPASSRIVNLSGSFDTATLSAASHTIKIQVWTNAGTGTFLSGTGSPAILSVAEFKV